MTTCYHRIVIVTALCLHIGLFAQEKKETTPKDAPATTWENSLYLELTGRTGIIEKKRHAGGIQSIRTSPVNRLKLYANYAFAEESGIKTEEYYIAGIDDEHNLSERTAWYGRAEYEFDDIEELRARVTVATGIGYYFIKEKHHKLRGRVGAFWRWEDYKVGENTDTVGLEVGVYHQYHIEKVGVWTSEVVYSPSLEDDRNYRIKYESTLELPIERIKGLSVDLGVFGEYNNYTPGPLEHYDTNYFVRLKYKW